MVGLAPPPDRFRDARSAVGSDHVLLEIRPLPAGMNPAVEDVHHRDGEERLQRVSQVLPEPETLRGGGRTGDGHGDRKRGVCAEVPFVRRSVEIDEGFVHRRLFAGVHALQGDGDLAVDPGNGALHPFAAVSVLYAVAEFDGLVFSGRCPGRGRSTPGRPAGERDVRLDGRVPP